MFNLETMFEQLQAGNITEEAVLAVLGDNGSTAIVKQAREKVITPKEAAERYVHRLESLDPVKAVNKALDSKKKPKDYNYCLSLLQYMLRNLPYVVDLDVEFEFNPHDKTHHKALIDLVRALFPMEKPNTDRHHEFLLGQGLVERKLADFELEHEVVV